MMDDIERLLREARPDSGARDRPLSKRAERELDALVGEKRRTRILPFALATVVVAALAIGAPFLVSGSESRLVAGPDLLDPSAVLRAAAERLGGEGSVSQSESAFDAPSLVTLIEAGELTTEVEVRVLAELADSGRATRVVRGVDGGEPVWKVEVGGDTVVLRVDSGEIVALIDADGEIHRP
jgi:hypothetical protein